MALTRAFVDGMQARAARDPAFPESLLRQGIDTLLAGDVDPGLGILRAYINATVGFEKLARATGLPPKSLQRMFSATGNPRSRNLFQVLHYLQWKAGDRAACDGARFVDWSRARQWSAPMTFFKKPLSVGRARSANPARGIILEAESSWATEGGLASAQGDALKENIVTSGHTAARSKAGISSMRSVKSVVIILVLSSVSAFASAQVKCPMKLMTAEGTVHALSDARVFQGPVSKNVAIVPVHGNFDLAQVQGTGGGDPFNLVCTYEGTTETQTIEVPRTATTCNVADAGAGTVAGCR